MINRSLVYSLITLLLGLSFIALSLLLEVLVFNLLDQKYSVVVAIISALGTIALFRPASFRLQQFIDHRFFKIHIDYQTKHRLKPSGGFQLFEEVQQVGDYEITEMIALGGMSEIYKGTHLATGEEAAVKILVEPYSQEREKRKQFFHEAQTISRLEHNNIIKLIDYGETGELNYMILEFISNHTLANQISTHAPLNLKFTHSMIDQISQALDYAHQLGIIHRDIKPSNVLLRPPSEENRIPQPVLTDFGVAKADSQHNQSRKGGFVGSLDYISPEQIQASDQLDHRADIYSLGVMTFQMLTGQLPFHSNNRAATLIAHIRQPAPNILAYNPELPDKVAFAVLKAMSKNPEDRFNRASDFALAIKI